MATRKATINGKDVELVRVEPLTEHQPWCEYQMPNGDIVRAKIIAKTFWHSPTEKNADGSPVYALDWTIVVDAQATK